MIAVIPGTSELHAETFARALGGEVRKDLSTSPVAFFVGVHPGLKPLVEQYRAQGTLTVAYWIGSDSLCAVSQPPYRRNIPEFDMHLAVHERIQKELASWSVKSEVVWPCPRTTYGKSQEIKERAVGIYCPTPGEGDIYMFSTCMQIARSCPELTFRLFGTPAGLTGLPENVEDWGRKDPDEIGTIYDHVSCILRLCTHDGNPVGGIEAKQRGLHVIENYPYSGFLFPKEEVWTREGRRERCTVEAIIRTLKEEKTHQIDESPWPSYYRERCSPKGFKENVEWILQSIPRREPLPHEDLPLVM